MWRQLDAAKPAAKLFVALALVALAAPAAQARSACQLSPRLVGRCFQVRGRLLAYNGTPTFRIWPIGSHRLLGVNGPVGRPDDPDEPAPPFLHKLAPRADLFQTFVYGDYLVCPFTRSRPGRMQFVCIAKASRLVARPR
jgi:hypothetical protein